MRLTYSYDAVNNRTSSVTDFITGIQRGVETFDYDALNRVTRVYPAGQWRGPEAGGHDLRRGQSDDRISPLPRLSGYAVGGQHSLCL
ncbi:MAG: hypothetical protein HC800_24825 [Phormidesmis sp. RL_2_1]|nr:hypothetical protein [Phormidesmis sp. RL_2_1]